MNRMKENSKKVKVDIKKERFRARFVLTLK